MRPYELAFVLACFMQLAALSYFAERRWFVWVTGAVLAGAFALHARSQNLRIDMLAAYFVAAILMAATVSSITLSQRSRTLLAATGAMLLGGTVIFAVLHVPVPRGKFMVGSVTPDWRFFAPQDPVSRAPQVEFWYPVDTGAAPRQSFGASMLAAFKRFLRTGETGLPSPPLNDAPLASRPENFPILLCFSGGAGEGIDTIYLVKELVSQGFVVATVHYPAALFGLSHDDVERREIELARPFMDMSSEDAFHKSLGISDERVRHRADDASSIVDAIKAINAGDPNRRFTGRLDISRIGIFGFSFGGAVAAEAAIRDKRFKAALNIDGAHFAEAVQYGIDAPYMLMLSDETRMPADNESSPSASPEQRNAAYLNKRDFEQPIAAMARHGGYLLTISGARHLNLMDDAFRCVLFRRMPLGAIDPNRAYWIVANYAVAFFQRYLQNQSSPLLESTPLEFNEAHLQVWRRL